MTGSGTECHIIDLTHLNDSESEPMTDSEGMTQHPQDPAISPIPCMSTPNFLVSTPSARKPPTPPSNHVANLTRPTPDMLKHVNPLLRGLVAPLVSCSLVLDRTFQ